MHVDHVYPLTLHALLFDWVTAERLRISQIPVDSDDGTSTSRWFADRTQAESWQEYHRQNAKLEVVTKKENLSRKKVKLDWTPLL
jgi:hypothetical protein